MGILATARAHRRDPGHPERLDTRPGRAGRRRSGFPGRTRGSWRPSLGTPEEIAATVAFLVSRGASSITGSVIRADGGDHRPQLSAACSRQGVRCYR
ncbi:hypothetical protein B6S44_08785 [Bosea sp. Tri-44]|nr:hypothetical protein B6S44_08785 [Bosea sp. Tri-44]